MTDLKSLFLAFCVTCFPAFTSAAQTFEEMLIPIVEHCVLDTQLGSFDNLNDAGEFVKGNERHFTRRFAYNEGTFEVDATKQGQIGNIRRFTSCTISATSVTGKNFSGFLQDFHSKMKQLGFKKVGREEHTSATFFTCQILDPEFDMGTFAYVFYSKKHEKFGLNIHTDVSPENQNCKKGTS